MNSIVVAYDKVGAIGENNDLPWGRGLPSDLARFKELTLDTSVIMGRNTYESLPPKFRPLPGRENIVLSRNPDFHPEGVLCVNSLAKALSVASKEAFVIGGAEVYAQALPVTDRIYATEVLAEFPAADTFFPALSDSEWTESDRIHNVADDKNAYDFDFVIYDRKRIEG